MTIAEIPSAEGRGIRKSSRVVMKAGMEANGQNVSPKFHRGWSIIPLHGNVSIPGPHEGWGQNTNPEYQLKPRVSASRVATSQLKEPRVRLIQGV